MRNPHFCGFHTRLTHVRPKTHGVENRQQSAPILEVENRRWISTPKTDMAEKVKDVVAAALSISAVDTRVII